MTLNLEITDKCAHCGATLPESLIAPALCDDCEDDRLEDLADEFDSREALYDAWEMI